MEIIWSDHYIGEKVTITKYVDTVSTLSLDIDALPPILNTLYS